MKLTLEQVLENYPNYNYIFINDNDMHSLFLSKNKPEIQCNEWITNPEIGECIDFDFDCLDYSGDWRDSLRSKKQKMKHTQIPEERAFRKSGF